MPVSLQTLSFRLGSIAALSLLTLAPSLLPVQLRAQAWIPPAPEELSMTSAPEVPGAPAIYLYKEETTDDMLRMYSYYSRIKVLTEGGKDYANIELPFGGKGGINLDSISARTIHPDGTIIPFTGKPYDKVVEKIEGHKYKERVFTLPDVTVGSIIEYRYKFHYDDSYFLHPDWFIQSDLFVRKAHYAWKPNHRSNEVIVDSRGNSLDRIAWTPILPDGVTVVQTKPGGADLLEVNVTNVKPLPKEDFMPPIGTFSYRVLFYYTSYSSGTEFWSKEGKHWSKEIDKFIGPGKQVKEAVSALVAPADAPDVKLHKIYNAVAALENTDFTRERSTEEEKAAGLKAAQSTDDILARKRGSGDQLAALFVAMTRAAGLKSYLMGVADRSQRLFNEQYLSLDQLDDDIAIVNVDGKDIFFDPGQRYCAYGQLSWKHYLSGGLRQTDGGNTAITNLPSAFYRDSTTSRVADLALDDQGLATGPVVISYTGAPALRWRQEALRGDTTSLDTDLKESLEHMLPGGIDVKVGAIENLTDPGKPLKVTYEVKGPIGSSTGKRLLVPGNIFESNSKPRFPQATREETVDLHYSSTGTDAVRYKLPPGMDIESAPADEEGKLNDVATFKINSVKTGHTITSYRNVLMGRTYFLVADYASLRAFYGKIEAKDQETIILTRTPAAAKSQ